MKQRKNAFGSEAPEKKSKKDPYNKVSNMSLDKRRRYVEATATLSLLLLAVALLMPFAMGLDQSLKMISIFKWVYAVGALGYLGARCVPVNAEGDSLRLRRLRRLEFWAGVAFAIAGFFWFFNARKFGLDSGGIVAAGPLAIMRDTILFSLVGAMIQLIASWMISFRMKKEQNQPKEEKEKK